MKDISFYLSFVRDCYLYMYCWCFQTALLDLGDETCYIGDSGDADCGMDSKETMATKFFASESKEATK